MTLLSICREPNCGSFVERDNIKIVPNGAMIRVHTTCNNHHVKTWDSSPMLGTGRKAIAVINILIGVYSLLTGLHIKQVQIVVMLEQFVAFEPLFTNFDKAQFKLAILKAI